jgi:PAS domain S-box-containing protein
MVSGDVKELGRIRQANSSCRFVFGYDPRDLVASKINKLMPPPFANVHDKFLTIFLNKGKSSFLERNQPLPVITKDGYL